ncbi:TetR/AcrR family transcriptional regulator [Kribbella albertanoniae]|uniref:TetR/AcrR family transcriptional regulator n=1 Tax=Kribbella albertanoniae TaxID=1266829 RepID=A0A4R4QA55_9ACTN|nr:TetR/AcrR family transcriptional regulator [Kribbella albertanoniae]TDC32184.1 TetR/AcrR family transcriptional regulator [Kribbella albertanoniae]
MTETRRGRPRSFDREAALEQALLTFWERGYDATSVSDLTAALGIGAPSLYAAFGDKRSLFNEVITRYQATHGAFTSRALDEEPTARAAITRILREAATEYTATGHAPGCLIISAAQNTVPASAEVAEQLREIRRHNVAVLRDRIQSDLDAGVLPAGTDAEALAGFFAATIQGMSQQARDGATRRQLLQTAELALAVWDAPAPAIRRRRTPPVGQNSYPG